MHMCIHLHVIYTFFKHSFVNKIDHRVYQKIRDLFSLSLSKILFILLMYVFEHEFCKNIYKKFLKFLKLLLLSILT